MVPEQRNVQQKARPSIVIQRDEERYRAIAEMTSDFVYEAWFNADGSCKLTWLAGRFRSVTGYPSEALRTMGGICTLIPPEDRTAYKTALHHLRDQQAFTCDFRLRTKAHGVRWFRESGRQLDYHEPSGALKYISTVQDITEQKRIDQALHLTQHAVDHVPGAILWLDERGKVIYANAAASALLKYETDDLLRKAIFNLQPGHSEETWARQCDAGKARGSHIKEAVFCTQLGESISVEVKTTYVDFQGTGHWIAALRDITENKIHEAQLIQSRKNAEELNDLKSTFLENLSHEIRTPLAGIIGFASVLRQEVPQKHQRFVSFIESSGKRLLDTLNSILDLSMLESGTIELHREVIDISQEVNEKVATLQNLAQEKGLYLRMGRVDRHVEAYIDRMCLDRILSNLITNAVKFTDDGGVDVSITGTMDEVCIEVTDTGVGISKSFLPHIFSDFMQEGVGLTRSHEGMGLGLAITKRLVGLMGGRISVDTERGQGSTFRVTLPRLQVVKRTMAELAGLDTQLQPVPVRPATRSVEFKSVEVKTVEAEPMEVEPIEVEPIEVEPVHVETVEKTKVAAAPRRVLVVEDNEDMHVLLSHYFRDQYNVTATTTGQEALRAAADNAFDLVLMDINLGKGMTGVDVMKALRQQEAFQNTPIIALTAYALPGDREVFLESGFTEYLGKPFTRKQLEKTVQRGMRLSGQDGGRTDGARTRVKAEPAPGRGAKSTVKPSLL